MKSNIITSFEKFNESNDSDSNSNLDEKRKIRWTQNTREIVVPQFKEKSLKKLINKLNRFSKTIGFPTPIFDKKEVRTEYIISTYQYMIGEWNESLATFDKDEADKELVRLRNNNSRTNIFTRLYDVIDVTIVDEVRPLEDWEILGTIDYKDGLVKPAPGKEVPMDLLQNINLTGSSNCDHCNKTLRRNKTVFVHNTEDDTIKQVGGTCTKYYLGIDYQKIMNYLESLHELSLSSDFDPDDWDMYSGGGESISETFSISEIIKYYAWWVKKHNTNISKKGADAYNQKLLDADIDKALKKSTGELTSDKITYVRGYHEFKSDRNGSADEKRGQWEKSVEGFESEIATVTDEEVQEIYDFIESKKGESNFMFNVSNKVAEGYVDANIVRYITGACSFFFGIRMAEQMKRQKEEARHKLNAAKAKNSIHIGTIGEKTAFENIEIKRIGGFETQFGWSNVYNMEDTSGNVIVKFGKIGDKFIVNDSEEIEVGAVISFTADIKDHKVNDYDGVPQTTIGRLSKFNPKLKY